MDSSFIILNQSKLAMSNLQQYFVDWCRSYGVEPTREEAAGYV